MEMLSRPLYLWRCRRRAEIPMPLLFLCLYFLTSLLLNCAVLVSFRIQIRGGSFEILEDPG